MLDRLVETVTRHTEGHCGQLVIETAVKGVSLLRSPQQDRLSHSILKPTLCFVVQGAKQSMLGDKWINYRAGQALVVSIEMPAFGRIVEATQSKPYLSIGVELDIAALREVMESLSPPPQTARKVNRGVFVTDFHDPLADCLLRLMRLLDSPSAISALYPLIMREICYWLLTSPYGGEVANIVLGSGHMQGVIHAIHSLRENFDRPIRIEELADRARMSASAFHRQFKQTTSMTPLQFQKQLRLLEARRLMLTDSVSAEAAAYQVGYESASQFSREYARTFGAPPRRDIARMKTPEILPPASPQLHGPAWFEPQTSVV
ncbi:AraC family transcriptional regulator [Capsulimonas corticalis]|uniref:AraC family transcriptional regulator n=1 Tax=Capsulimonas corticalis TaxID=2219043 RepID=A0A402CXS9_9BACT|nr:AraC family transcriptional regulator [Capsulimonas corticalis]BDI32225.1 AraC family transcriptional regulator [Capsulimonas corticalis]